MALVVALSLLVLALAVIRYFVVPVRPAGWGAGIPALSRWATMRLFQADQMHVALVQLRNSLGPIFLLPPMPFASLKYAVVVTEPQAAKLALRSDTKGPLYDSWRTKGEQDIFSGDGELWKKERKLANPAFSYVSVRTLHDIMVEEVEVMFQRIDAATPATALDPDDLFSKLALDIIGRTIYGQSFHAQTDAKAPVLVALQENLREIQARDSNPLRFLNRQAAKRFQANAKFVRGVAHKVIAERRKKENWREVKDLLTLLMKSQDSESGEGLSDDQIAIELEVFISAGHETTAHSMAWVLYHLANNPAVLAELRQEIDGVMADRTWPTQEGLKQCQLLQCVIKETMRLTPVAPTGSARVLLEDAELCGVRVPKGTTVWVPFYPMFVDPALWDNPRDFRPDRFKEVSSADPKYTPFSAGPRNCIGQAMAMQEMEIAIAALVRTYDFRLAENCHVKEVLEITLKPIGMLMYFTRRLA